MGQRVGVAWTGGCCGTCRFCTSGRENLCADLVFTGWDRDGGFATAMTARADFVHPLPEGFDDLSAAPLLCGGVIGYRSLRIAGVDLASARGTRLGLYGFGASATIVIQLAVHAGCEVHVVTRSEAEQRAALDLGAAWAGGYGDTPPVALDAAITFAPSGDVVVAALAAVERGGIVAVNAIHLDRIPQFDYDLLWGSGRCGRSRTSPGPTPASSSASPRPSRSGRGPRCSTSPRPTRPWPASTTVGSPVPRSWPSAEPQGRAPQNRTVANVPTVWKPTRR